MKTKVLLFSFVLFLGLELHAQTMAYDSLMRVTVQELKASSPDKMPELAARFERLMLMAPQEWLPVYYAAYCLTVQSFSLQDGDAKDNLLNTAQQLIDKALELQPKESELWVLQALVYQGRIMVNPMSRGMKYSQKVYQSLDSAEKMNADNPRVYYLRGQNLFNTPKMFGGGQEAAKPNLVKAQELFDNQIVKDPLWPEWGKQDNRQLLSNCK